MLNRIRLAIWAQRLVLNIYQSCMHLRLRNHIERFPFLSNFLAWTSLLLPILTFADSKYIYSSSTFSAFLLWVIYCATLRSSSWSSHCFDLLVWLRFRLFQMIETATLWRMSTCQRRRAPWSFYQFLSRIQMILAVVYSWRNLSIKLVYVWWLLKKQPLWRSIGKHRFTLGSRIGAWLYDWWMQKTWILLPCQPWCLTYNLRW